MPRLVVFDLDGTLIDSRQDLADATNALLLELGAAPLDTDVVAAMVGEGVVVLIGRALTAAGLDPARLLPGTLDRFLALYDERLLVHTLPYAGIVEALDELTSDCMLAVLTNKPARATATILARLDLAPYFDHVIGGDTPLGRKPDPAGLLRLVQDAGAAPDTTVLVGDSRIDLETARAGRTRVCLARYGFGFRFAPDDFRGDEVFVDRPADLVRVLDGLHPRPRA